MDSLTRTPGFGAQMAVNGYIESVGKHAKATGDMRPLIVQALFLLDLGKGKDAAAIAARAKGRKLRKDHRRLMGDVLEKLMVLDPWRQLLWEPGSE